MKKFVVLDPPKCFGIPNIVPEIKCVDCVHCFDCIERRNKVNEQKSKG